MTDELTEKEIEYLLLLLLSTSKKKRLSHLHIQKEMFLLRDVTKALQSLFHFIKHFRGPFSKDIKEALSYPMYLDNHWIYKNSNDKLTGGYIELTKEGENEGNKLIKKILEKKNDKLNHIMAAMNLLHDLYDNLTPRELLYVIYKSPKYKDYTEKSIVYKDILESDAKERLKQKFLKNIDNESLYLG
ncbi:MAG: hypothetical protein ACXACC_05115 [Promethearchaeota archaeon]|jgi:hypothetical protein